MMINVTENVRKMTGWCPNARAFEARKSVQFDSLLTGASGSGGGIMKKITEQPAVEKAVAIVGMYAVLSALVAYIQSSKITINFEGFGYIPRLSNTVIVVIALISPFFAWFIGTGVMHLVSKALGGKGKFYPQMTAVVGYSFIPMILAGLISIALLFMIEPMTVTISPANSNAAREIYDNLYIFGSSVIAAVLQIIAAVVLFFGVQSVHRLTPVKSAIVAGIPLAFSIISLGSIRADLIIIPILMLIATIGYYILSIKYMQSND